MADSKTQQLDEQQRIDEDAALWFTRVHSQRLSDQQSQQFKAWLQASKAHADAFESIAGIWQDFDEMPRPTSTDITTPKRQFSFFWKPMGHLVAACFIAAVLFLPYSHLPSMLLNNMTLAATDSPKEVTLSDGSRLFLNHNTRIRVAYETQVRQVYLDQGTAYFKVKSNPYRPFIVQADQRRIQVVGTEFEVNKQGQQIAVNVSQGIVTFQSQKEAKPVFLLAGQSAVSPKVDGQIALRNVNPQDVARWRYGELVFVDKPLSDVLAELKTYSSFNVELSPSTLAARKISGRINLQRPEAFFQALPSLLPVQVVYQDKTNLLIIQNKQK
ncbi:FecR family protein [Providencia rustigianii]|uniref:FecR family protein n=1 Tax=Providencia rustigianii TaxID=158850 RepID=UPI0038B24911